ncbi:hypothetical protein ACPEIF_34045 [Streptomyces sp. NPDC012600]|uniref:hypothetical protein n=1 Tax=unclassified Streptomyces TaxID=2593676 RepID=UPI00369CA0D9
MFLEKVNQDASLDGLLSERGPEGRVAPVMATPTLVVTPATGKATALVGAAAVGYVTTKVK